MIAGNHGGSAMTQEGGAKTTAAEIEEGGAMGVLVQLAKVLAVDHAAQGRVVDLL
jgi:hypothetical protein